MHSLELSSYTPPPLQKNLAESLSPQLTNFHLKATMDCELLLVGGENCCSNVKEKTLRTNTLLENLSDDANA